MATPSTPAPAPAAPAIDWRRLIANSALGLVGDTGSGKSTLVVTIAEYVWTRYRKVTRYYSVDPGGFGDLMYSLILKGIVQVWRMRTRDVDGKLGLATGTCAQATRGYWPAERDPLTGDTRPNVPLVPPFATMFTLVCPQGHDVKTSAMQPVQGVVLPCPTCKVPTSLANCKEVRRAHAPIGGFDQVGCIAFDSGTAMADWCMVDVDARAGRDELGGEKGAIRTVHSAGEMFGTAGRAGVGFVQNRGQDWIYNAIGIPGLMVPPVFTFRKDRGTDNAGLPIYGPKLIGIAKTAEIPGWLGNCFGVEGPGTSPSGRHRLCLSQYALKDSVTHLVKHRAAAGLMPEYLEDEPGATVENGQAYVQFNLGHALDLLLQAVEKTNARSDQLFPSDTPGLGTGKVEVPEGVQLAEGGAAVAVAGVARAVAAGAVAGVAAAPAVVQAAVNVAVANAQQGQAPAVATPPKVAGKARAVASRAAAAPAAAPAASAASPVEVATTPPPVSEPAPAPTVADVQKEMAMPPTMPQVTTPANIVAPSAATITNGTKIAPPAAAPRGAPPRPPAVAPVKKPQ